MIGRNGEIKVLDFGVACAEGKLHNTASRSIKGKLAYLAPDYVSGQQPDRRVDIFSLGVVLWELLANERLFGRQDRRETLMAVLHNDIPSPKEHNPHLPTEVARVILRALERDREKRYATALEMGEDLEDAARRLGGLLSQDEVRMHLADVMPELIRSQPRLGVGEEAPSYAMSDAFTSQMARPGSPLQSIDKPVPEVVDDTEPDHKPGWTALTTACADPEDGSDKDS